MNKKDYYANRIFICAALPLLKTIASDVPSIKKKFEKVNASFQISAVDKALPIGKIATSFKIANGVWEVFPDKVMKKPDIELEFKSIPAMNAFFKGSMSPSVLPKMKGVLSHIGLFAALLSALLKMSALLGATKPPEDAATKKLTVKCFFYLLSSGISALNKSGHDAIHGWALKSPDRVYAFAVNDNPDVSAYIRVKAGQSKSGRGVYTRALPFFTLRFRDFDSALGILMGTDDMLESTRAGKLIMDGAPEFGAQLGDFLLLVGDLAK
ncbi:MAG: hypothetical protein FWF08_01090 [Oscillospiraceae bacterium]|nr:hypothetical protein [Oscillospiraceae bacterium]